MQFLKNILRMYSLETSVLKIILQEILKSPFIHLHFKISFLEIFCFSSRVTPTCVNSRRKICLILLWSVFFF